MCYCIGKAACRIKEFYLLPVGGKLIQFDSIAVNTIVANKEGEVSSCDIPFSEDLSLFNQNYLQLTQKVADSCVNHDLTDSMVIGTSALVQYEIDGAVGMYSGIFNNPFLIWGKYKHGFFKTTLTVSFQFHHTQMDGQYEIDGAVGMYSGIFNNPFLIWGKYKHGFFKTTLTVSFQFHHTQMDGAHASRFLDGIQSEINNLSK